MDNFLANENKNNKYLENLLLFILQMKEIKEYMEKENEKIIECYLINHDIINLYFINEKFFYCNNCIDDYKNENKISHYSDLYNEYNEFHFNNIITIFEENNINIKNIKINPIFLLTEKMKYNGIIIPNNFFILKRDYFFRIFGNNSHILKDFILYKVLICKEGIFIWDEKNEKDRLIVYYLYYLNKDILK